MAAHQSRIADNLSRFRQLFHPRELDYRIGVVTTDFVNAEPGRRSDDQPYFKEVRSVERDPAGNPVTQYNASNPQKKRQTLDGCINTWVLRPFIIAKGNQRGKIKMHAVVSPNNISHRRGRAHRGTVLYIESDFSGPLAALGDRIADTVAGALEPVEGTATFYKKSIRVLVDGQDVRPDPPNGYVYDELTHSMRFQGAAKKQAFLAKIDISYEGHM